MGDNTAADLQHRALSYIPVILKALNNEQGWMLAELLQATREGGYADGYKDARDANIVSRQEASEGQMKKEDYQRGPRCTKDEDRLCPIHTDQACKAEQEVAQDWLESREIIKTFLEYVQSVPGAVDTEHAAGALIARLAAANFTITRNSAQA